MFPLGSPLLPFASLPLHVFEPRYRAMLADCLAGSREFGVVLIERGSEVGGGDQRFDVGTVARIADVVPFPDGRSALTAVGTARLRVLEWLPEDPYPRARVELATDDVAADAEHRTRVEHAFLHVLDLLRRLGADVPVDVRLDADAVRAGWQAAAPLGPLDAQRVLATDDPVERLDLVATCLDEIAQVLELRLEQ
jgi:Lon protease-like protein